MYLMQQAYGFHSQDNNIARYIRPPDEHFKQKKLTA